MTNDAPYPQLSIIIVNYLSADLVYNAVQSIYTHTKNLRFEIIVVDNSSDVKGKEKIEKAFPLVQWLDMGYNAGFSRANNAGMRLAKGDAFLLLNPDTLAIDNSISICYHKLMSAFNVAAGVQLLDESGEKQISGNYFVKGGLNHLLPIPYWGDFIRWGGYTFGSKVPNVKEAKSIEEVDWISGAFLMVKKEAVGKAGLMDEDFFLYAEEVEWCSRLNKVGQLCIFGELRIIHLEGATINKSQQVEEKGYYNLYDKKGLQLMVSNHLRVRKQYGVFWFLVLLLNYTWGIFVFAIASFFHQVKKFQNPFAQWSKVGQFAKNVARLWGLTPAIIRNQPRFYKMF